LAGSETEAASTIVSAGCDREKGEALLDFNKRVRPNNRDVAAKVLDGEAIMINLARGTYYSLDKVGTLVWELIEGEHTLAYILEALTLTFEVSPETAEADLQRLVGEMLDEGIVVRVANEVEQNAAPPTTEAGTAKLAYTPPELSIYRDMADLLALEPPTPGAAQEELWQDS
jgi:hypothetical protein